MKKVFVSPILELNKNKEIVAILDINISKYFEKFGYTSSTAFLKKKFLKSYVSEFDLLVLSGTGDIYKKKKTKLNYIRDQFELDLYNYFVKEKKTIITICRGFQLVGSKFKNKLYKIKNHVKKNHFINFSKNNKKINTNSYHNFGFKNLNKKFDIIATSDDFSVELSKVKNQKVYCFMFHPERANKDQKFIDNIIKKIL